MFLGQKDPGFACATWSDNFDVFWDTLVCYGGGMIYLQSVSESLKIKEPQAIKVITPS